MVESNYSAFGLTQLPLDPDGLTFTIGTVADPSHKELAIFCRNVILAEIGDAWDKALLTTSNLDGYAVGSMIPFDVARWFTLTNKSKFPLLAVSRGSKPRYEAHTLLKQKKVTDWKIEYVLPELDDRAMGVLFDVLNAIPDAISGAIWERSHPAYKDGYNILEQLGFTEMDMIDVEYGEFTAVNGESNITFPCVAMIVRTSEIKKNNPPTVPFLGADVDVRLGDEDPIDHFIDLDTDDDP